MLPDAALVAAVADRTPAALEELYRRHSVAVFGVARRVTGVPEHGEEVLQEVFLRLWRSPDRFDPDRGRPAVVPAHGRERPRHRARAPRCLAARAARNGRLRLVEPDGGDDIEGEHWDLVVAEHLRQALDALSPTEREAIELAYYGDHTYREVAAILGLPEGTVKSRIRTGLKRMRDRLVAADIGGPS